MKILNMYSTYRKVCLTLASALIVALTVLTHTACKHKDLCRIYDYTDVIVKVNFKNVEKTEGYKKPGSMRLYVYELSGNIIANVPLDIYQYEGQTVTLPVGTFHMMVINEDSNTIVSAEEALIRKEENTINNILTYKITTPETELKVKGFRAPKLKDYEDHIVITPATPTYVGLNKMQKVLAPKEDTATQVIEFFPEDPLTRYTIVARDVKNAENYLATRAGMEGAISGALYSISDGFFPYDWVSSKKFAIVPHQYKVVENTDKPGTYDIITFFRAFGSPAGYPRDNKLQIYVLAGKEKYKIDADVTNQIRQQADPRNVYIELKGLVLPIPIGGFSADVDEWKDGDHVDISL